MLGECSCRQFHPGGVNARCGKCSCICHSFKELEDKMPELKEPLDTPSELQMTDELIQQMTKLSNSLKALSCSRLRREAIIILLWHQTRIPQRDVKKLWDAMESMPKEWLKPEKGK
jgi:hypothetical protein